MGVTQKLFQNIVISLVEGKNSVESIENLGVAVRRLKDQDNIHLAFLKELTNLRFPILVVYKKDTTNSKEDDVFSTSHIKKSVSHSISDSTVNSSIATVVRDSANINNNNTGKGRKGTGDSVGSPGYGGSPLKLQAIADLSMESPMSAFTTETNEAQVARVMKYGIPVDIARSICSWMHDLNQKTESQMPQLLVFCDANHITRTAALIAEYTMGYIKATKVSVRGPMPQTEVKSEFQQLDVGDKQLMYKAKYNISDKMVDGYSGVFMMETEWNKSSFISPLEPPPTDSRTEIKVQVVLGKNVATYNLYKQLAMLQSLVIGLETSEVDWLVDDTDNPALEKVQDLVQRLKLGDAELNMTVNKDSKGDSANTHEEYMACFESITQQERKDLDFTDHLWSILCQCVSHHELIECLQYVFCVLSTGDLNPMVHRHNTTTVAEMVRESYSGKFRVPNLAGLYPLQLLAEMGAEKLRQDYVFALLSKDLVTLSNLESLIGTKGTLKEKCSQLERLQAVVEMMVLLNLYLKVPYSSLSSCAREMLRHYEQNEVRAEHTFTFTMPTSIVRAELDTLRPCQWELNATKRVQTMVQSMKYVLLTTQPFPHIEGNVIATTNGHATSEGSDSGEEVENWYYLVKKEESLNYML